MKLALPFSFTLLFIFALLMPASAQVERSFDVKDFSKIRIGSYFNVTLKQGNSPGVLVRGKEKDLDEVEVKNDGSTLVLRRSHEWRFSDLFHSENHDVQITVTYTHLEAIQAGGASTVRAEHILDGNSLKLDVSGASDMDVEVDVSELICSSSGASDLKLFGQAGHARIHCSGASEVKGKSFRSRSADLDCSGASTIHIGVDELLDANASGASDVYVYGSPRVRNSRSSGASDIHFREKASQ